MWFRRRQQPAALPPPVAAGLSVLLLAAAASGARGGRAASAPRVGDAWGTNIHWTHEQVPGEAAQLAKGYRVARMDFSWSHIEQTCGEYNFSAYDDLLATMEAHGVRPYWILDYGNPCYPPPPVKPVNCTTEAECHATCQQYFNTCPEDGWWYCCTADPRAPSGCTQTHSCASNPVLNGCACGNGTAQQGAGGNPSSPALMPAFVAEAATTHKPHAVAAVVNDGAGAGRLGINDGCGTPECIAAFAKFASAAGAHFKGRGVVWECLNEPNGMGNDNATTIAALCLGAGKELAALGEYFVGPATAGIDIDYLDAAMTAGILGAFGGVSVHPYRGEAPDTVLDDYVKLRALIESHGATPTQKDLPILSGEWGYTSAVAPCNYGNDVDELTQAAYLARMWLVNTLAGVQVSINYDWKDDGADPGECEANFGSVRQAATPNATVDPYPAKPKYTAAVVLQQGLGNFQASTGRLPARTVAPSHLPSTNVFILAFANATTAPSGASAAAAAAAGVDDSGARGFAVWTNGSAVPGNCSAPGHASPPGWTRLDCGYRGIGEAACVSPANPKGPGCCWEPNVTAVGGPQCYLPVMPPATDLNVTFVAAAPTAAEGAVAAAPPCWKVVGLLGEDLGTTCADAATGVVAVSAPRLAPNATHNAPVYLLPA